MDALVILKQPNVLEKVRLKTVFSYFRVHNQVEFKGKEDLLTLAGYRLIRGRTNLYLDTEAVLLRAVSHLSQVANGRHLPFSFGMVNPLVDPIRDRAARLRSSDAQHLKSDGILDTKNRDVVAEQLRLF